MVKINRFDGFGLSFIQFARILKEIYPQPLSATFAICAAACVQFILRTL